MDLGAVFICHNHALCGSCVSTQNNSILQIREKIQVKKYLTQIVPQKSFKALQVFIWPVLTTNIDVTMKFISWDLDVMSVCLQLHLSDMWLFEEIRSRNTIKLTLNTTPQIVVPVFRAAGTLHPSFVISASKRAFLEHNPTILIVTNLNQGLH